MLLFFFFPHRSEAATYNSATAHGIDPPFVFPSLATNLVKDALVVVRQALWKRLLDLLAAAIFRFEEVILGVLHRWVRQLGDALIVKDGNVVLASGPK